MIRKYLSALNNNASEAYTVRTETLQGKNYLVVPVTMIVQGVLAGSRGPLLHLAEDFGKVPASWNGIPVVINHPQKDGTYISANCPEVMEQSTVGIVYNTIVAGNNLKSEAWLEESKLTSVSPDILSAVQNSMPVEISVGVFTEEEPEAGEYNGVNYTAIARNHKPDHLALLPDAEGACSLADGCGIRVNKKKGGTITMNQNQAVQLLKERGFGVNKIVVNAEGLMAKLDEVRELVRSLNPTNPQDQSYVYHYLIEVYDGYLIYEKDTNNTEEYYKCAYQLNVTSGEYQFVGDPTPVNKVVSWVPVPSTNELVRTKFNINQKEEEIKMPCTPCVKMRVDALIANTASGFTEDHREMLSAFNEVQLDALAPKTVEKVVEKIVDNTREIQVLSAEDHAALDFGKAQLKSIREAKVSGIIANTAAGIWKPEALNAMDNNTLDSIYKSVVKADVADYSLNGNAGFHPQVNAGSEEALYPVGVNVK